MAANGHAPIPPQNLDAEESVVGAMMMSPRAIEAVEDAGLSGDDFYRHGNGVVYETARRMHAHGEPVDAITLADQLDADGMLEKIGGRKKVHELAALPASASNAAHYARIVRETAGLRRLIRAGGEIAQLGWDRPGELDELLGKAESMLSDAVRPTFKTQFSSLAEGLDDLIAQIEEAIETGRPKMGLRTGFRDLDEKLSGFHPGQLIVVAARPSMGKSLLAQNIGENTADLGKSAAILSLEMSKQEIQLRALSRASGISTKQLRTGQLPTSDEVARFRMAVQTVKGREPRLFVEDNPATTAAQLRAEVKRLHRQHSLSVLFVDYIQLMLSDSQKSRDGREQEVAAITRGLKLVARELNIPVVALSQLNRNLESREDKRPRLSDLRESGAIEQDADVVLFIYRDEYYNPDSDQQGIAEVIVGKNRNGESGTVKLAFVGGKSKFSDLAKGLVG